MKKKTARKVKRGVEIGSAVTAAVLAAAAGAYFLADKKNRTKAKSWVVKAKKEVAAKAKAARKLGEKEYDVIVDQVVKRYGPLENLSAKDVIAAAKQLKAEWKNIRKHAATLMKPAKKKTAGARKVVRKKATKSRK